MEDAEPAGMSFGEVCRLILRRIWYVVGVTVAVALAAVLIVLYVINPAQRWYSMRFELVFPTGESTAYPDGEPFFYRNMVDGEALAEVKRAAGLTDLDTDGMTRRGDVEISATAQENGVAVYTGSYTVRVKSSYFSGAEEAEAFIRAIAQRTVDRMQAEAGTVSYAVAKDTFDGAPFEERLDLLAEERETILQKYDEWIDTYDSAYRLRIETGTGEEKREIEQSLKDYRASASACFGESRRKELVEELESGGYHFTDDFTGYTRKLAAEYAANKTAIRTFAALGDAQGFPVSLAAYGDAFAETREETVLPNVSQRLVSLIERNNAILHWLGSAALGEGGGIEPTLTEEANAAFGARLEAERLRLEEEAALLTKVTQAIYSRGMSARFDTQSVGAEGGTDLLLAGLASAVIAFAAACIVVYAVEMKGRKRQLGPSAEKSKVRAPAETAAFAAPSEKSDHAATAEENG